jgi:hypothetical protein
MSRKKTNTQKITSRAASLSSGANLRGVKYRRFFPMPELVACEVDGRSGYWRAIHSNGLVQTVKGTKKAATRAVAKVVRRMDAFESWCRHRPCTEHLRLL